MELSIDSLNERGGTLLVDDDGNMVAWLPVGDHFVEVTWTPGNYPALYVNASDLTSEQIVEHINTKLQGWNVRKCNLPGVNIIDGEIAYSKEEND